MKRYKINRDKKSAKIPSDEVINKYKSFNDLRAKYNDVVKRPNVPFYKNPKLFLLLILIVLLAFLLSNV